MTVKELIDAAIFCDVAEIVIRENGGHGKWIQGYRIGKNAKVYPSELTMEVRELMSLKSYQSSTYNCKEGEILDIKHSACLPMKVICKDVHKLPEAVGALEVADFIPRHVPHLHNNALVSNNHELEINCYPVKVIPDKFVECKVTQPDQLEGQLSIEDIFTEYPGQPNQYDNMTGAMNL